MAVTEKRISKSKPSRSRKVDVPAVRRALLAWYDLSRRDLPWRENTDAYRVWVSEIMLQQTRVDVVRPYFLRWMEQFPTLDELARADVDSVLKQWEGLGYYSRARNLHGAARMVRERLSGVIPQTSDELRMLPGVGEYTAGAIASIAYNESVPAVDGNVRRVLSRLFDVDAPTPTSVRPLAQQLVDPHRPGDGNQALMELGATVCTPRSPRCTSCPLNHQCRSYHRETVHLRPGRKPHKEIPHEQVVSLLSIRQRSVLLAQRPANGLLGGLWEFPEAPPDPAAVMIGSITHTFSHKRVTYVLATGVRRRARKNERWIPIDQLHLIAMPAAQRKLEHLVRMHLAACQP